MVNKSHFVHTGLWQDAPMTPKQLLKRIRPLSAHAPYTEKFDKTLEACGQRHQNKWWIDHKEHWICWLVHIHPKRSAAYVYNHINCPPMLIWLPEAAGILERDVSAAIAAALEIGKSWPSQCGAIRRLIPWQKVEQALAADHIENAG